LHEYRLADIRFGMIVIETAVNLAAATNSKLQTERNDYGQFEGTFY
jgi:hypothetical protein